MSAEVLREAAALMRERAKAAQDVRGVSTWQFGGLTWCDQSGESYDILGGAATVVHGAREEEAEHIASWHPAVALAVADWLEATANNAPEFNDALYAALIRRDIESFSERTSAALAVARAYLGSDQ